jgi:hypothetical protein
MILEHSFQNIMHCVRWKSSNNMLKSGLIKNGPPIQSIRHTEVICLGESSTLDFISIFRS